MLDINAMMADEVQAANVEKIEAALEQDTEGCALLDAAKSVEEVYDVVKRYLTMKFEAFKAIFEDALDYLKQDKAAIPDETLDCVVGGASWLNTAWNWLKRKGTAIVIGAVAGAVIGGIGGAALGGPIGFIPGTVVGAVVGAIVGAVVG